MWVLKPSPIYGTFSALILYLSIPSLANKFDSIALGFDLKRMQSHQKKVWGSNWKTNWIVGPQ